MSPLPNRPLQPPQPRAAESAETPPQTSAPSDASQPVVQRPLVRPVARPQSIQTPPAPTPPIPTPADPPPAPDPIDPPETRQQPIPAPSEPMQYRAIGLLRGRYKASEEQFTRGEMTTADGTAIEAVLLGRVMSLVKNHLDLEQEHLWVVYPRTREKQEDLHVQIVGVWEPENLSKPDDEEESETQEYLPSSEVEDNYFSIRGEVIFHSPEDKSMIVKIQQAPRKKDDRAKMFKLKLNGELTGKAVGYFWELNVQRVGADLVVQSAKSIGMIPPRKKSKDEREGGGRFGDRRAGGGRFEGKRPMRPRPGGSSRPTGAPSQPPQQSAPRRTEPLPKPVKRRTDGTDTTNVTSEA